LYIYVTKGIRLRSAPVSTIHSDCHVTMRTGESMQIAEQWRSNPLATARGDMFQGAAKSSRLLYRHTRRPVLAGTVPV